VLLVLLEAPIHRATRALRDGDNEMRRVTGESSMARKTDTYHYAMETDAAVTAMLMDGRLTCEGERCNIVR
jgi:hypothetical protein